MDYGVYQCSICKHTKGNKLKFGWYTVWSGDETPQYNPHPCVFDTTFDHFSEFSQSDHNCISTCGTFGNSKVTKIIE